MVSNMETSDCQWLWYGRLLRQGDLGLHSWAIGILEAEGRTCQVKLMVQLEWASCCQIERMAQLSDAPWMVLPIRSGPWWVWLESPQGVFETELLGGCPHHLQSPTWNVVVVLAADPRCQKPGAGNNWIFGNGRVMDESSVSPGPCWIVECANLGWCWAVCVWPGRLLCQSEWLCSCMLDESLCNACQVLSSTWDMGWASRSPAITGDKNAALEGVSLVSILAVQHGSFCSRACQWHWDGLRLALSSFVSFVSI